MTRKRNIFKKLHRDEEGVIAIMGVMFLATVGITMLMGMYLISVMSSTKSYLDGASRAAAYGAVTQLVDTDGTTSGNTGAVVMSTDTSQAQITIRSDTNFSAPQALSNIPMSVSGIQPFSVQYAPSVAQAKNEGGDSCDVNPLVCWTGVDGIKQYTSGVQVDLAGAVPFIGKNILSPNSPQVSITVHGSGDAAWGQSAPVQCPNGTYVEVPPRITQADVNAQPPDLALLQEIGCTP